LLFEGERISTAKSGAPAKYPLGSAAFHRSVEQ
jgi:hypothetical protein